MTDEEYYNSFIKVREALPGQDCRVALDRILQKYLIHGEWDERIRREAESLLTFIIKEWKLDG